MSENVVEWKRSGVFLVGELFIEKAEDLAVFISQMVEIVLLLSPSFKTLAI